MAKGKTDSTHRPYSVLAIASFIFGLLFLTPIIGGIFGIVAVALGFMALQKIHQHGLKGKGLAIAGVVMGGVGVFGMVTFYGLLFYGLSSLH
jgi:hypothetical protein